MASSSVNLEKWASSGYSHFIEIGNAHTLAELHRIWALYAQTASFSKSRAKDLKDKFLSAIKKIHRDKVTKSDITSSRSAGPLSLHAVTTCAKASPEFWKKGVTFTQESEVVAAEYVNPLFAYATDGEGFFSHYGTMPLGAFHLAPAFADRGSSGAAPLREVYDVVQGQFRSWCDAFHACVQPSTSRVKIRVLVGDVLAVCQVLRAKSLNRDRLTLSRVSQWRGSLLNLDGAGYSTGTAPLTFDVIDTSNLCDHLGIVNILVATAPLLKPLPSTVLLTETLLSSGKDPMVAITDSLCGDLTTMSLLFDLTPTSYISGYKTDSNIHEVVSYQLREEGGQYHERLVWKAPSRLSTEAASSVAFNSTELAAFLYTVYHKMFTFEDPRAALMTGVFPTTLRSMDLLHYSRRSFASLLAFLRNRIVVRWDEVVDKFIDHIYQDPNNMTSMLHYQDFLTQLHLMGLHSEPNFTAGDPLLVKNKEIGRFRDWSSVPPIVCVAFTVPRSKLQPIETEGAPPTPILQVSFAFGMSMNNFSSMEIVFGSLSLEGEGEDAIGVISEAADGKNSQSSIVVSICVPAWLLVQEPTHTSVRLILASTPSTAATLALKLGLNLILWQAKLSDVQQVHVLRGRPTVIPEERLAVPYVHDIQAPEPTPLVTVTLEREQRVSLTRRVDVVDPVAQTALRLKETPVKAERVSATEVKLSIGSVYRKILSFPFTFDMSKHKLRVARQSSYIEVSPRSDTFDFSR